MADYSSENRTYYLIKKLDIGFKNIIHYLNNILPNIFGIDDKNRNLCDYPDLESLPALNINDLVDLIDRLRIKIRSIKKQDIFELNIEAYKIENIQKKLDYLHKILLSSLNDKLNSQKFNTFLMTIFWIENALSFSITPNLNMRLSYLHSKLESLTESLNSIINTKDYKEFRNSIVSYEKEIGDLNTKLTNVEESSKTNIIRSMGALQNELENIKAEAQKYLDTLQQKENEANKLLEECEDSKNKSIEYYRIITANGLAGSFQERAKFLNYTSYGWILGLILSLFSLWWIGGKQVHDLKDLFVKSNISSIAILLQTLTAILSISAPLWFAWLSTTQINKLFKLAEDYGFKSSVSQSYEGYKKEISDISPQLQQDLIKSLLKIINDEPLRLVKHEATANTPAEHFIKSCNEIIPIIKNLKNKNKSKETKE